MSKITAKLIGIFDKPIHEVSLSDVLEKMNKIRVSGKIDDWDFTWEDNNNFEFLITMENRECSRIKWQLKKSLWDQSDETKKAIEETLK